MFWEQCDVRCFIAGDDDAEYDFDLVFVRRQREAASVEKLAWLLPPAQTGFSACLWLRVSATQTGGTILSLGGSERIVTSRDALPGNDQHDVIVTVDNRPVETDYVDPLTGTLAADSNSLRWLVHWPLIGGLLHLVQRGRDWAGPQPAQALLLLLFQM